MATESENQNRPHTSQATAEQGEACFSDLLAKKQGFLAADSFLFWNADDVRPIRDRPMASEPPSRLQLHTGRSQETAKGHWPWGGGGGGGVTTVLLCVPVGSSCHSFISGNGLGYFVWIGIQASDRWLTHKQRTGL